MSQSPSPTPPRNPDRDRLLELLADQAIGALSAEETAELERLREVDRTLDPIEFERGAAAAHVAFIEHSAHAVPEDVRNRLAAAGAQWARQSGMRIGKKTRAGDAARRDRAQRRTGPLARLGWLAAAACLALAAWGWWPWIAQHWMLVPRVNNAADKITVAFASGNHASGQGATGEVVWSNTLNKGYIRIRGLQVNDPSRAQYQMWIGDKKQEHPIDAGVFNITSATDEIILPINGKLNVTEPTLFAITEEQPGGVVVSDLKRIAVMADPSKATH